MLMRALPLFLAATAVLMIAPALADTDGDLTAALLQSFYGLNAAEIEARLPDDYVVVAGTGPLPAALPEKLRVTRTEDGSNEVVFFGMNLKGRKWEPVYAFETSPGSGDSLIPAFLYLVADRNGRTTYEPVVVLRFDIDGTLRFASRLLCAAMVAHPSFGWRTDRWLYGDQSAPARADAS